MGLAAAQFGLERHQVQAHLARVTFQVLGRERTLVFVQRVVHRPELALWCRGFRELGRRGGVRMRLGKRKVAEHEAQLVAEPGLHFFHDRVGHAAVRTLVVAVLDQRHGCVGGALGVIVRAHRCRQLVVPAAHGFLFSGCRDSRAESIPSAPGLMSMGER